jgi:dimethylamine--corrinoid protein Co-methyltransferase
MWPKEQGQAAEKAGASIFGPAVTTKIGKSFPWNIGRSVTYVKSCTDNLEIPVHPNLGMGVGGIPMTDTVPVDVVTRTAKAMVEIAKVDGI